MVFILTNILEFCCIYCCLSTWMIYIWSSQIDPTCTYIFFNFLNLCRWVRFYSSFSKCGYQNHLVKVLNLGLGNGGYSCMNSKYLSFIFMCRNIVTRLPSECQLPSCLTIVNYKKTHYSVEKLMQTFPHNLLLISVQFSPVAQS